MESENPFETEEVSTRYVVGIDLGTTNSALAFVDLARKEPGPRDIRFLEVPQLSAPGEVARRRVLPSFLYLPGAYELPPGGTALPWDPDRSYVVGELAREQGALVPGRLVSSAKSWLCHGGVDRTAAILPWGTGAADVQKVSPVAASARYLLHLREAWNHAIARGRDGYRLEEQLIVLTVPASFDEVARELTVAAAREAGLPRTVLVEEPLAAFYAWLSHHETDWETRMQAGQIILVCDVGGGTTDFTIVATRQGEKGLRFDRLAVGEHLMLGGDNMDLALARHLEAQLTGAPGTGVPGVSAPGKLDARRWHQLAHGCRKAKETLLTAGGRDVMDITLMGTGRKLIADTLKGSLHRNEVEELILDGFFPSVPLELPSPGGVRRGLTEWGLPYVQDPAVTRHMAAFWLRFQTLLRQETGRETLYPDYILFNGGALTPDILRRRILSVVGDWFRSAAGEDYAPAELENPHPELAVAMGAAYYGLVRLGEGVRVGAGSPRAYYVEVHAGEMEEAAAPDEAARRTAVCLVARGTEEGFETRLEQPAFEVRANQPAVFQLFNSSTRLGDRLGDVVTLAEEEVTALPPVRTVLRYGKKGTARTLPVQLAVRLTEVGTLELWCASQASPHRWQLQFDVRQEADLASAVSGETLDVALVEQTQQRIAVVFSRNEGASPPPPEKLVKDLTTLLDLGRERWPTSLIRKMADALLEVREGRGISPAHEARWFNLLGYCLRPGFGDPLDEWRIKEAWKLYRQGLQFSRQAQGRSEWWIFWRRVAGGLSAGNQRILHQQLAPGLISDKKKGARKGSKTLSIQEEMEMWMALANLERLPLEAKTELGRIMLEKVCRGKPRPQELWALSRFGARIPFYGPLNAVIPHKEASHWVTTLLASALEPTDALAHTLVQLARQTGDRARDLPTIDVERVTRWLEALPGGKRFVELITNPETALLSGEKDWVFGEALPAGLILAPQSGG